MRNHPKKGQLLKPDVAPRGDSSNVSTFYFGPFTQESPQTSSCKSRELNLYSLWPTSRLMKSLFCHRISAQCQVVTCPVRGVHVMMRCPDLVWSLDLGHGTQVTGPGLDHGWTTATLAGNSSTFTHGSKRQEWRTCVCKIT